MLFRVSCIVIILTTLLTYRFPFVCVSIGLTIGKVPTVGVVYNPILNEVNIPTSITSHNFLFICGKSYTLWRYSYCTYVGMSTIIFFFGGAIADDHITVSFLCCSFSLPSRAKVLI